jgi:hypothetical protein
MADDGHVGALPGMGQYDSDSSDGDEANDRAEMSDRAEASDHAEASDGAEACGEDGDDDNAGERMILLRHVKQFVMMMFLRTIVQARNRVMALKGVRKPVTTILLRSATIPHDAKQLVMMMLLRTVVLTVIQTRHALLHHRTVPMRNQLPSSRHANQSGVASGRNSNQPRG